MKAFIGILIFAVITLLTYFVLHQWLLLKEDLSVVVAIVCGGVVEFVFQRMYTRKEG